MFNLAKFLINDLERDWNKPSIKFFRSNNAYGYIFWLTLMSAYYENNDLYTETFISKLAKYASRRTILDFIDKGIKAKFIEKKSLLPDKRRKIIIPSELTIDEYEKWSEEFIKSIN